MIRGQSVGWAIVLGILGGIFINTYNNYPTVIVYAQEPEAPREIQIGVRINWTPERIQQEIEEQAAAYGRSARYMAAVIDCESMGSTTIQSGHTYGFTNVEKGIYKGDREKSFGLVQIHLPDHPDVTREQAIDPAFAINFMAKNLGKVKWYCEDVI